jgi:hypothetical protein
MAGMIDNPIFKRGMDLALPVGIVAILFVMILPVPPIILDLFLTFNITVAIIILLVAVYVSRSFRLSRFSFLSRPFRLSQCRHQAHPPARRRRPEYRTGHKSFSNFVVGNYTPSASWYSPSWSSSTSWS